MTKQDIQRNAIKIVGPAAAGILALGISLGVAQTQINQLSDNHQDQEERIRAVEEAVHRIEERQKMILDDGKETKTDVRWIRERLGGLNR